MIPIPFIAGLVTKFPFLGSRAVWAAAIVGGALLLGFTSGLKVAGWRHDALQLAAERQAVAIYEAGARKSAAAAAAVAADLVQARRQAETARVKWRRDLHATRTELASCKTVERADGGSTDAPPPAPDVVLSGAGIELWNRALTTGLPPGSDPGRTDGGGSAADPVALSAAFDNLEQNSATCNEMRRKLAGWRDLARRNGWAQ